VASYLTSEDLSQAHPRLFKERVSEGLFLVYGSLKEGWRVYTSPDMQSFSLHGTRRVLPEAAVKISQTGPRMEKPESLTFRGAVRDLLSTREGKAFVRDVGGKTDPPKDCEYYKEGWCRIDGKPCPYSKDTWRECPKLVDAQRHPEDQFVVVF